MKCALNVVLRVIIFIFPLFQLFGGIIEHGLVNMIPLGLALRFVLVKNSFSF